jgi:hypothetical protein
VANFIREQPRIGWHLLIDHRPQPEQTSKVIWNRNNGHLHRQKTKPLLRRAR